MDKAVFIDLQGTLGTNPFGDISVFTLFPYSKEALEIIYDKGYKIFIITNQSRIGAGFITYEQYQHHAKKVLNELTMVEMMLCCPHTRYDGCECKKPKKGMIDQVLEKYDIDLSNSYVIGDMGKSDMVLADRIGAKSILVLTGAGKSSLTDFRDTWNECEATKVCENIIEAAKEVL